MIEHENPEHNVQGRKYPAAARKSQEPGQDRYIPVKTSDLRLTLRLVHPLSREFSVYGTDKAVRRAREWALDHHYYKLDTGHACAHSLYLMRCPKFGNCLPYADHTQVWVPAPDFSDFGRYSGAPEPFILTQPYRGRLGLTGSKAGSSVEPSDLPAEITAYAAAHGLNVDVYPQDDWYNPGSCLPIRLTTNGDGHVQFPLETEALSLMCAWRDDWPETIPEWLR